MTARSLIPAGGTDASLPTPGRYFLGAYVMRCLHGRWDPLT